MLDSCCSKYMSNNGHVSHFVECEGVVLVLNNNVIHSFGMDMFWMMSMVDGVEHYITLHNVMYRSRNTYNFISIAQTRKYRFRAWSDNGLMNMTHGQMNYTVSHRA